MSADPLVMELAALPAEGAKLLQTMSRAAARLAEAEREIMLQRERIAQLEALAMTDELTGLGNRRGFRQALHRELSRSSRGLTRGTLVIMLDIDRFKQINDSFGHMAGDDCLRLVARLLIGSVRDMDVVARLGGDEYAILMPDISAEDGARRAGEISAILESVTLTREGDRIPVRISLGHAMATEGDDEDRLLARADDMMYQAKASAAAL